MIKKSSKNYSFTEDKMKILKCYKMILFFILFLIIICSLSCKKSSTEPSPSPDNTLLLNRLSVAMVPGASETVLISIQGSNASSQSFSATCDNENIATVSCVDSVLTITGIAYGKTNVRVTSSSSEKQKTVPVEVYNPEILDGGELLITFAYTYEYRWCDRGSGGDHDGSYYHPVTTDDFQALGSLGFSGYYNPNNILGVMVVKAKQGSEDALAHPVDYTLIYNDAGSGANDDGSFWTPVPPEGYKAMGVVAQRGWGKPSLDDVVCVREDLTIPGSSGAYVWHDVGTGANMDFASWLIDSPVAGPHENAYLSSGTFVGWSSYSPPSVHPAMNVLNITLPMLIETPYQTYVPRLTGYDPPPPETVPILAREMLVPCTIVKDQLYASNFFWRVSNSPFYRLERQVYYKLLYHNHNQTSETQTNSVLIRSGVTTEESNSYWEETSISVTAEAGISIKAFEAKVSTTVSRAFGYETTTSVAELHEKEISSSINTSPGKAAALWQRYNRFVLKRHNGLRLEPVSAWEFGIDSYVTDEYPHE
jgi:hypothetical protein